MPARVLAGSEKPHRGIFAFLGIISWFAYFGSVQPVATFPLSLFIQGWFRRHTLYPSVRLDCTVRYTLMPW